MSGSGGGGGGGGFDPPTNDCASLSFDTQLSSPKAPIVSGLKVDDVLEVTTQVMGDSTVVVALHRGKVAGGVASPFVQRLRECIEGGTAFTAPSYGTGPTHPGCGVLRPGRGEHGGLKPGGDFT